MANENTPYGELERDVIRAVLGYSASDKMLNVTQREYQVQEAFRKLRTRYAWPPLINATTGAIVNTSETRTHIPDDVRALVIAARETFDELHAFDGGRFTNNLDKALEAFSSRVPYSDQDDVEPLSAYFFWLGEDGTADELIARSGIPDAKWRSLYAEVEQDPKEWL